MLKKFIEAYYHLFDSKIKNWTLVVFIVSIIIILIWLLSKHEQTFIHLKSSLPDIIIF